MWIYSHGTREYNYGMPQLVHVRFECALVVASHGYILGGCMNERALLKNVMYKSCMFLYPRSGCKAEIVSLQSTYLRAISHMKLTTRDQYTSSTLIGGKGRVGPNSLHMHLHLRDQWSMWMQDECKVYMDSYMAFEWIIHHGHLGYVQ
jgi:hypothetical protein